MTKYFFHCTDGTDFVLDPSGEELEAFEIDLGAEAAAAHLARGFPASFDWSGWIVAVYDSVGQQVAVIPFPTRPSRPRVSAPRHRPSGEARAS
jgi:hypothetical protein